MKKIIVLILLICILVIPHACARIDLTGGTENIFNQELNSWSNVTFDRLYANYINATYINMTYSNATTFLGKIYFLDDINISGNLNITGKTQMNDDLLVNGWVNMTYFKAAMNSHIMNDLFVHDDLIVYDNIDLVTDINASGNLSVGGEVNISENLTIESFNVAGFVKNNVFGLLSGGNGIVIGDISGAGDGRWLRLGGENANQDIDINGYDFTACNITATCGFFGDGGNLTNISGTFNYNDWFNQYLNTTNNVTFTWIDILNGANISGILNMTGNKITYANLSDYAGDNIVWDYINNKFNATAAGGFTYSDWFNQQLNTTNNVTFTYLDILHDANVSGYLKVNNISALGDTDVTILDNVTVGASGDGKDISFFGKNAHTFGYIDGDADTQDDLMYIETENNTAIHAKVTKKSGGALFDAGLYLEAAQSGTNNVAYGLYAATESANNADAIGARIESSIGTGGTAGTKSLWLGATNGVNQVESTALGTMNCIMGTFLSSDAPPFSIAWFDMTKVYRMKGSNPMYGLKISGDLGLDLGSGVKEAIHVEDLPVNFTGGLIIPTTIPTGANLQAGSVWLNTTTNLIGTYDGTGWRYR